jgi:hypothetical protein
MLTPSLEPRSTRPRIGSALLAPLILSILLSGVGACRGGDKAHEPGPEIVLSPVPAFLVPDPYVQDLRPDVYSVLYSGKNSDPSLHLILYSNRSIVRERTPTATADWTLRSTDPPRVLYYAVLRCGGRVMEAYADWENPASDRHVAEELESLADAVNLVCSQLGA